MTEKKPRQIAAWVLQRREGGEYVENLLEEALRQKSEDRNPKTEGNPKFETRNPKPRGDFAALPPKDRALCQELVYGVVRWQAALDWLISRKTGGRTQKAMLQNILRLGLYQIFWLDRIPNHAAVNETVEQAKQSGFGPQAGFVNAVLRGYLREFDGTKASLADLKKTHPSLGYSHPEWLVARWQNRWGTEKTAQLMEWNNTPPKTYARVNTLRFLADSGQQPAGAPETGRPTLRLKDTGDLLTRWREEDVEYDFVRRDWFEENQVFELKAHPPFAKLRTFQEGYFYIQDPSTLLAVRELNPQPGETILDFCAAPGGKLAYMAQLMNNNGRIVAHDVSAERLKLVEENCARLGITCVETIHQARMENEKSEFDRILVDAPCSNTGVMRRRVDLRWRIRADEIARLHAEQLGLLRQAAAWLRPGGTLVYSTCSLEPEENEELIKEFLDAEPNWLLESQRELLPFIDGTDGAYVAKLIKK